jgi:hypothetical protein
MRGGRRCSRQITSEHARPVLAQRTKVFASAVADVMAITKWSIGRNKRRPYAISLNESDLHLEFCLLPARDTIPGARNRTGKRHMKFVLVNGRRPRPQSFCALCGEAIGESYCENLQRGSLTAITRATPVTARLPPQRFKGLRRRHDNHPLCATSRLMHQQTTCAGRNDLSVCVLSAAWVGFS